MIRRSLGYTARLAVRTICPFSEVDSAPFVPKSVVSHPDSFAPDAVTLGRRWNGTFIYEAHVRGATMLHPDIPEGLKGTYDGSGVAACSGPSDQTGRDGGGNPARPRFHFRRRPARAVDANYWGYNTIGFFAPEPRYFGPSGVYGFRAMVDRFHAAGIEVILDVVYNHSAKAITWARP